MNARRFLLKHRRLRADTSAATAVEYGLIVALVVIVMVVALVAVADTTVQMWTNIHDKVARAR